MVGLNGDDDNNDDDDDHNIGVVAATLSAAKRCANYTRHCSSSQIASLPTDLPIDPCIMFEILS